MVDTLDINALDQQLYWAKPVFFQPKVHDWPAEITLTIARLDQLHPYISGNKWPKMRAWWADFSQAKDKPQAKGNLKTSIAQTMGGAHSNHLVAFAAVGKALGIPVQCFVRANGQGAELIPTPTTLLLESFGVDLVPVSRQAFRDLRSYTAAPISPTNISSTNFFPEGGCSVQAVLSVAQWAQHHQNWLSQYDVIYCGCGTGTWLAGLVCGLADTSVTMIGVPAVAGQKWLSQQIQTLINASSSQEIRLNPSWALDWSYPDSEFGPVAPVILQDLATKFQFDLDPVYMPRILICLQSAISKAEVSTREKLPKRVLVIHGGGLQAQGRVYWPAVN